MPVNDIGAIKVIRTITQADVGTEWERRQTNERIRHSEPRVKASAHCAKCPSSIHRADSLAIGLCAFCAVKCPRCHVLRLRLTERGICDPCDIADKEATKFWNHDDLLQAKADYADALAASQAKAGIKQPRKKRIYKPSLHGNGR